MTFLTSFLFLFVIIILAAIPSSSVLLVTTRSVMLGVRNGFAAAIGIVAGDLVFMLMAILGMTALAEHLGAFFVLIKYLAALYLIWFGIGLVKGISKRQSFNLLPNSQQIGRRRDIIESFAAGLLLTLGDVKAIFFYASLLPTFLDLAAMSAIDVMVISLITVVGVGGVKSTYAIFANKLAAHTKGLIYERSVKVVTGSLMIGVGAYLIVKN